jgi:hypothetical protein
MSESLKSLVTYTGLGLSESHLISELLDPFLQQKVLKFIILSLLKLGQGQKIPVEKNPAVFKEYLSDP